MPQQGRANFGTLAAWKSIFFPYPGSYGFTTSGYAPICSGQEDFIVRRLYNRVQDCFGRPISSAPDVWFDIVHRYSNDHNKTMRRTSKVTRCLNLGSYNYLGFAAADYCTPRVIETLKRFSPSTCSPRVDGGTTTLHKELEESVANFVGKPAAIVFGMGHATNTATLPVLIGKGGLIISDSLNHNSIINGARGSGSNNSGFPTQYAVSLGGSFEAAYCGGATKDT
ncbi:hypothetical protein OIU76_022418 [Salix suchowensis]|nr:hypothetical protein OIU76_022418 [Salix suchowensis]